MFLASYELYAGSHWIGREEFKEEFKGPEVLRGLRGPQATRVVRKPDTGGGN